MCECDIGSQLGFCLLCVSQMSHYWAFWCFSYFMVDQNKNVPAKLLDFQHLHGIHGAY